MYNVFVTLLSFGFEMIHNSTNTCKSYDMQNAHSQILNEYKLGETEWYVMGLGTWK